MHKTINQLEQDLARAGYAESTRMSYLATARELARHVGKPIARSTREEVREYVDAVMARPVGTGNKRQRLNALSRGDGQDLPPSPRLERAGRRLLRRRQADGRDRRPAARSSGQTRPLH